MSKLLSYELLPLISGPEVEVVLSPGALIQIFDVSKAYSVIDDDVREKRILKAIWLLAICFPTYSVSIPDLASVISEDAQRIRSAIDRNFLESNSKMVTQARFEIERCLDEASIVTNVIKRRKVIVIDQADEIRTTFIEILQEQDWEFHNWPVSVKEDSNIRLS